jgi:hypothetical protein
MTMVDQPFWVSSIANGIMSTESCGSEPTNVENVNTTAQLGLLASGMDAVALTKP